MKSPASTAPNITMDDCLSGVLRHRTREAYGILGQGLWLLNAHALHCLPRGDRGQGRKSLATVTNDLNDPSKDSPVTVSNAFYGPPNPGFEQWLEANLTSPDSGYRMSRKSCSNYMMAAQKVGLKAGDTEETLAALEAADALEGRRISDLYKPTPVLSSPVIPETAKEQLWLPFQSELDHLFAPESKSRMALYAMHHAELDTLERQLRFGLETIREVKTAKKTGGLAK